MTLWPRWAGPGRSDIGSIARMAISGPSGAGVSVPGALAPFRLVGFQATRDPMTSRKGCLLYTSPSPRD
eukprot:12715351-Alexandrium_andersonii.AAC.1